jgi:hypothetical protein
MAPFALAFVADEETASTHGLRFLLEQHPRPVPQG